MIAKDLISLEVPAMIPSNTGEEVLNTMNTYHVMHLPIIENEQLIGIISEDDILSNNMDEPIRTYPLTLFRSFALEREHIFEVMAKMSDQKLSVIPVVAEQDHYVGLITLHDLMLYYANSYSFSEPGSIIVLETTKPNYSLAEISRIVEGEGAVVISSFLTNIPNTNILFVTLKLNKKDIQHVVASLNRFEYTVTASYADADYSDALKENYDSLMSYLNV